MNQKDSGENINSFSLSARIVVLFLLLIVTVSFLIVYFLHDYEQKKLLAMESAREYLSLNINAVQIKQAVVTLKSDVRFLSKTPPVQGIIEAKLHEGYDKEGHSSLETWEKRLQHIFMEFARARPNYFQIRFIGVENNGKEIVRINSANGHVVTVSPDKLQSKAGRSYYDETIRFKPGQVYLSKINLNREWDKIEKPYIRTIRAGVAIYSESTGKLFGVLVINMSLDKVFKQVSESSPDHVKIYLINNQGDFLIHPDKQREFGFDLNKRFRWRDEFPGVLLKPIVDESDGERPQLSFVQHIKAYLSAKRIVIDPDNPGRYLTIIYQLPQSVIAAKISSTNRAVTVLILGLALIVTIIVGLILHRLFKPLHHLTRAAHAIGEGDYSVKLKNSKSAEIATLIWAFRRMLVGITEREKTAAELADKLLKSEQQASTIIDTAPEAIVVYDKEGRIKRFNAKAVRMFGYSADEVSGQSIEMLIPERLRQNYREIYRNLSHDQADATVVDDSGLYVIRKDGTEIPVEVVISVMQFGDETLMTAVISDITQRKQAEQAMNELNLLLETRVEERTQQLAASNKELEQFAYVASHDLQEPLRMIASYLQLLERRYKNNLDQDAFDFIEYAVDGANRMKNLINGLLEYSRVQTRAKKFEKIDLSALIENVLMDIKIQIQDAHAKVIFDNLPIITGDSLQIRRLFQNLITNAIKYSGDRAPEIYVSAEKIENCEMELPPGIPLRGWLFSVKDNGIGFEEKYADRIFRLFQRLHTREEYAGTGLGLAVCKRIVERHGGVIWARSTPGTGSTFYFILSDEENYQHHQPGNENDDLACDMRLMKNL